MKISVNKPCCICNEDESKVLFKTRYREHKYPGTFIIHQCAGCGLIFNSPRLKDQELAHLYGQNYYFFHRKDVIEFERIIAMYQRTVALMEDKINQKCVAEIGSAKGYFLAVLKELGWQTQGIEISPEASSFARDKFTLKTYTGTLAQYAQTDDIQKMPLVIAIDLIEHVSDPVAFIQAAGKIVEQDGFLLIDTPNGNARNISVEGVKWQGFNPFHIFLFSIKNLTQLLESNGFKVKKTFSYGNILTQNSYKQKIKRCIKDTFITALSGLGLLNAVRRIKNHDFSKMALDAQLAQTVKTMKLNGDYFTTKDSRGELAQKYRGDNIVVMAKKL
ncbi:hypothetical protein MNBD_UNCLBAC01-2035 [hydrothermal vent metagenome]|uniref:Uncharacterized protein n=1 Tax=hydrothermal vent metagenome TaxID=652676 RepID=A0A3B1DQA7_9ZZZZ